MYGQNPQNNAALRSNAEPSLIFRTETEYGLCLVMGFNCHKLEIPESCKPLLHRDEISFAAGFSDVRRMTWLAGRHVLRQALGERGWCGDAVLLSDQRGAPLAPPDFSVSLSHKVKGDEVFAAELVCEEPIGRIGVDIELADNPRPSIAELVLTPGEVALAKMLPVEERWHRTLVHFSLKEALYKAVDPFVNRDIDYGEAEVFPCSNGKVQVHLNFSEAAEMNLSAEAQCLFVNGMIISMARTVAVCAGRRMVTETVSPSEPISFSE